MHPYLPRTLSSHDLEYSPEKSRRPILVLIPDPCRATQHSQIEFLLVAVPLSTEIRDQYRLRKVGNDDLFLQPIVVPPFIVIKVR